MFNALDTLTDRPMLYYIDSGNPTSPQVVPSPSNAREANRRSHLVFSFQRVFNPHNNLVTDEEALLKLATNWTELVISIYLQYFIDSTLLLYRCGCGQDFPIRTRTRPPQLAHTLTCLRAGSIVLVSDVDPSYTIVTVTSDADSWASFLDNVHNQV
jgi:hypothetical protein